MSDNYPEAYQFHQSLWKIPLNQAVSSNKIRPYSRDWSELIILRPLIKQILLQVKKFPRNLLDYIYFVLTTLHGLASHQI